MSQPKISALVLAGGQDKMASEQNLSSKALLFVNGKPMAQHVLEALKASSAIQHIGFVGEGNKTFTPWVDTFVNAGNNLSDSLNNGLTALAPLESDYYLIITSDLPWVNQEALDDFLHNAPQTDLTYVGISKKISEQQFPTLKRTYVSMREGKFTGGNLMLLRSSAQTKLLPFVSKAYKVRKNPLKLAQIVGLGTLLGVAAGALSVAQLERRVSKLFDLDVRIYLSDYASLGADIDTRAHFELARKPESK